MKTTLLAVAACITLLGSGLSASAMSVATPDALGAPEAATIQVKGGGHGHGGGHHGWGHHGGRGHHYGWGRGHHYGWRHHHHW